jgi:hypothetical protein
VDGVGLVAKQVGARGLYGSVSVSLAPGPGRNVTLSATAEVDGQRSQGWSSAAMDGVVLGLELAGASGDCIVTRVHGMVCDTSPGLVAIAGVRATWAAASFHPEPMLAEAVEDCILRGHRLSPAAVRAELTGATKHAEPIYGPDSQGCAPRNSEKA